uniref:Uncharacterized protein n=1 Tax=viral metagenome TaxID=1070528 RepID=A0A6C0DRK3_9ZZZZ
MERIRPLFGIGSVAVILVGILWLLQRGRTIEIPEGFTTEIDTAVDVMNPITKIIKKVGALSLHFANPTLWKNTIETSKLSFTDLARRQIEQDKHAGADKIGDRN